jgi:hypothetical protein
VARIHRRTSAAAPTATSTDNSSIEEEGDDFDLHTPPGVAALSSSNLPQSAEITGGPTITASRTMMSRTTSLATVKVQKRAKLAEKLKAVFEVAEIEEVNAGKWPCSTRVLIVEHNHFPEMPCWLLRSVCM